MSRVFPKRRNYKGRGKTVDKRKAREVALEFQNGLCAYCLETLPKELATADHYMPRFDGFTACRSNIVAACAACNDAKSNLLPEEFIAIISSDEWAPPGFSKRANTRLFAAWNRRRLSSLAPLPLKLANGGSNG